MKKLTYEDKVKIYLEKKDRKVVIDLGMLSHEYK